MGFAFHPEFAETGKPDTESSTRPSRPRARAENRTTRTSRISRRSAWSASGRRRRRWPGPSTAHRGKCSALASSRVLAKPQRRHGRIQPHGDGRRRRLRAALHRLRRRRQRPRSARLRPGLGGTAWRDCADRPAGHRRRCQLRHPATTIPSSDEEGVAPEIWAYGLRHPQQFSWDADGRMFIGDIGQDQIEEVNLGAAARELWLAVARRHVRDRAWGRPGFGTGVSQAGDRPYALRLPDRPVRPRRGLRDRRRIRLSGSCHPGTRRQVRVHRLPPWPALRD